MVGILPNIFIIYYIIYIFLKSLHQFNECYKESDSKKRVSCGRLDPLALSVDVNSDEHRLMPGSLVLNRISHSSPAATFGKDIELYYSPENHMQVS
jgi:hypothetical protein